MITATSMMHPVFLKKVRDAMKAAHSLGRPIRVRNRFGVPVLMVEWVDGRFRAWADFGRDVTASLRETFARVCAV